MKSQILTLIFCGMLFLPQILFAYKQNYKHETIEQEVIPPYLAEEKVFVNFKQILKEKL